MKRLISLLLLFAMGLSLCACNINIAPVDPVPSTSEETSIDVTTPEESTADITTIQSTPEEESSTPPEQSTTPPEETSTIPVGTTTPPVGTTTPPIEETTPLPSDEKITIVFYHTMGESLRSVLDKYIVEFNKLYPNITIEHKQVGGYDDVRDQIKTEITVGQQPNIAYCYADHVAEYNVAQAVATLDDFIASMETITRADGTLEQIGLTQAQIDDFIDGFLAEGKVYGDDKMYTMPMSKSTEVLYYNKTFFETHGISVPTTWEEMEQVCEILKAIDPNCIPLGYDSEANWFITMCEQMNSPYTSATGNHYLFDNETNRNFVAMFQEWYQKGYVTTQELYGGYTSDLFTRDPSEVDNCYLCIASSAGANYHRSSFEVGIATVPQVDSNAPKVISQGPSLCIFKDSNEAEVLASWLFVKFLTTSIDFQAEFSMASGYMPVIKSVTENENYAAWLAKGNGKEYLVAKCVQVGIDGRDDYFVSPVFNGSSTAREQVGKLMLKCLSTDTTDVDKLINDTFKEALQECEY